MGRIHQGRLVLLIVGSFDDVLRTHNFTNILSRLKSYVRVNIFKIGF